MQIIGQKFTVWQQINQEILKHNKAMKWKVFNKKNAFTLFLGFICGFINGFLGSGGGIIAVQSLQKLGVETKKSHATSLFVILPLTLVSGIIYFLSGYVDMKVGTYLAIAAGVGGVIGSIFLGKINPKSLDIIFTLLILISGIRMVFG